MDELINKLKYIIPDIKFVPGDTFSWSPATTTISYTPSNTNTVHMWSLLHESGHAKLGHTNYQSDIELLLMEVAAWEEARSLARQLGTTIDEDHVQNCLDTYRDWLHQRSTCPRCGTVSLQTSPKEYRCHNCAMQWQVSTSRFCRPYRSSKIKQTKRPLSGQKTHSAAFM